MKPYNPSVDIESIVSAAEKASPNTKLLLVTTLNRYHMQLKMLSELQADINTRGTLVVPPSSKSRKRTMPNPSISEYARVASAANATVKTMLTILKETENADMHGSEDDDEL